MQAVSTLARRDLPACILYLAADSSPTRRSFFINVALTRECKNARDDCRIGRQNRRSNQVRYTGIDCRRPNSVS